MPSSGPVDLLSVSHILHPAALVVFPGNQRLMTRAVGLLGLSLQETFIHFLTFQYSIIRVRRGLQGVKKHKFEG